MLNEKQLVEYATYLKTLWTDRNKQIEEWYRILLMEDKLAQKGLESFVSNDPRTAYNLALHLLCPPTVPFRVPVDPLERREIPEGSKVEDTLRVWWDRVDQFNRRRGRKGWLRELVSYILATGWYATLVLALPNKSYKGQETDEVIAEIWAPSQTYPEFDDDVGLVGVVHSYAITEQALVKKARSLGWSISNIPQPVNDTRVSYRTHTLEDLWYFDDGEVYNAVLVDRKMVKSPTVAEGFEDIPVVISPASGLPDRGSIITDQSWRKHLGEALVATNQSVYHNYNKQFTFMQQLLRDSAQPVSFEKSATGQQIVPDAEQLYRRGAHFRMTPQDDLGYLQKPPIPVELRTMLFDVGNMIQRGSLPHVMYGNIQQQINSYIISVAAASGQQALAPYKEAIETCITDVCNLWLNQVWHQQLRPYGVRTPPKLPDGVQVVSNLRLHIPGDITQRATVSRMLNPEFKLSMAQLYDLLWPEVSDPNRELARINSEDALRHPVAQHLNLIRAYQDQAEILSKAGDDDGAARFTAAADQLVNELREGRVGQQRQGAANVAQPRQEVVPRGLEMLGEEGG